MPPTRRHRLLTIGHSYCVALNRRLAHEMARAGADRWDVTAAAPAFFHGDLRNIALEPIPGEACRLEPLSARLSRHLHVFFYGARLRKILRAGWDVVHCWEEPYIVAGGQIALWTPRRAALVFWTGQTIAKRYPPPFSMIERYAIARAAGWAARGNIGAATLKTRPGYDRKPWRVLPLGIDTQIFQPDPAARRAVRERLGWSDDGVAIVGYLGRMVEAKGLPMLLRALELTTAPWRALFVGGGPMEPEIRRWGDRFPDRVRIIAVPHAEVPACLNAMDLLCAPSQTTSAWREIFGRMLIEGFACGVPVIASDSGEIPAVAGDAAMIVGERDEPAWAAALGELLGDPARRRELAARGLDRVRSNFAWPIVARMHLEFFAELLDRRAPV